MNHLLQTTKREQEIGRAYRLWSLVFGLCSLVIVLGQGAREVKRPKTRAGDERQLTSESFIT